MNDRKTLRVRLSKKHWKLLLKLVDFNAPSEFWKTKPFEKAILPRKTDAKGKYEGGLTEAIENFLEGKTSKPSAPPSPKPREGGQKLDHRYDLIEGIRYRGGTVTQKRLEQIQKKPYPDNLLDHEYEAVFGKNRYVKNKKPDTWLCPDKTHHVNLKYCETWCERYAVCDLAKEQRAELRTEPS